MNKGRSLGKVFSWWTLKFWLRVLCFWGLLPLAAGDVGFLTAYGVRKMAAGQGLPARPGAAGFHYKRDEGPTFEVVYNDMVTGNGLGFDDPDRGAARRETLEAVLAYLGTILNEVGIVDILVTDSQTDGSGFLAMAGPLFFLDGAGFIGGFAFDHLRTGLDPCRADNCGEDFPDVQLTVHFGFDLVEGLGPIGPEGYDLFSILLHELTHGLGLLSFAAADGSGQGPAQRLFSLWDNGLYDAGGTRLWNEGGQFSGAAGALVGINGGVQFGGAWTTGLVGFSPAVHTPNPFVAGNSLSHWSDGLNDLAVMNRQIFRGQSRRAFSPLDLAALRDLGYNLRETKSLLYPWISNNEGQFESILIANNYGGEPANVRLTARRRDPGLVESTLTFTIPPYGFFKRRASEVFPALGSGPGYAVVLESDRTHVRGRWVTNNLRAASGASPSQGVAVDLPAAAGACSERVGEYVLFGYLPITEGFISAPVVVNAGQNPVDIELYFFNGQGLLVAQETLSEVEPLVPFASVTNQLVGDLNEDLYMVAGAPGGTLSGVVFVFNDPESETAIGNVSAIDFVPPEL